MGKKAGGEPRALMGGRRTFAHFGEKSEAGEVAADEVRAGPQLGRAVGGGQIHERQKDVEDVAALVRLREHTQMEKASKPNKPKLSKQIAFF